MLTILPKLSLTIVKVASKKNVQIVFKILSIGSATEEELRGELKLSKTDLLKKLKNLIAEELMVRWKSEDDLVVYTLHPKHLKEMGQICADCEFQKIVKREYNDKSIKFKDCIAKKPVCFNDHNRLVYNIGKMIQVGNTRIDDVTIITGKLKENDIFQQDLKVWNIKHFVRYYEGLRLKHFPQKIKLERRTIRSHFLKVKEVLKENVDNWRFALKQYIKYQFKQVKKSGKDISLKFLSNKNQVYNYLKEKGYDLDNVEFCKVENIYCLYYKKGCNLRRKGLDCSEQIIKSMEESYN